MATPLPLEALPPDVAADAELLLSAFEGVAGPFVPPAGAPGGPWAAALTLQLESESASGGARRAAELRLLFPVDG
jgi:hypothetical protein